MSGVTDQICSTNGQDINTEIYVEFQKSPTQNIAYSTIISDLLRGDLFWVKQSRDATVSKEDTQENSDNVEKLTEANDHWHHFVREFILNLCLYGYALIRRYRRGKNAIPVVARGTDVELTFNTKTNQWEPHAVSDSIRGTKGWHLIILEPPARAPATTTFAKQYVPTSAGYRSLRMTKISSKFLDNVLLRDAFNSRPGVFTQIAKNLLSNPNSNSKPWFQAVNAAMVSTCLQVWRYSF